MSQLDDGLANFESNLISRFREKGVDLDDFKAIATAVRREIVRDQRKSAADVQLQKVRILKSHFKKAIYLTDDEFDEIYDELGLEQLEKDLEAQIEQKRHSGEHSSRSSNILDSEALDLINGIVKLNFNEQSNIELLKDEPIFCQMQVLVQAERPDYEQCFTQFLRELSKKLKLKNAPLYDLIRRNLDRFGDMLFEEFSSLLHESSSSVEQHSLSSPGLPSLDDADNWKTSEASLRAEQQSSAGDFENRPIINVNEERVLPVEDVFSNPLVRHQIDFVNESNQSVPIKFGTMGVFVFRFQFTRPSVGVGWFQMHCPDNRTNRSCQSFVRIAAQTRRKESDKHYELIRSKNYLIGFKCHSNKCPLKQNDEELFNYQNEQLVLRFKTDMQRLNYLDEIERFQEYMARGQNMQRIAFHLIKAKDLDQIPFGAQDIEFLNFI